MKLVGFIITMEIIGEKLFIYDENRYRLYNPVFWHEASVNGAFADTKDIFKIVGWICCNFDYICLN